MFDDLNDDNFTIFAMKSYTSPHCIMSEFEGDIKRTKYLKKLFRRYKVSGDLKERLILNHLILLYNVFGVIPATRILFYRIDDRDYDILKTLAHEMVHVKQFALGELIWPEHNKYPKWFGKRINYEHTSYWDLPYEVEAHGREKGLVYQWCDERKLWKESWYRELF